MNVSELINRWHTPQGVKVRELVIDAFVTGREWECHTADLPGAEEVWDKTDLRGIDLQGLRIEKAVFVCVALEFASFCNTKLNKVIFDNSSLLYTRFQGAQIEYCQFVSACAIRADFEKCRLFSSLFMDANLEYAIFANSHLTRVDFGRAKCYFSDFRQAILEDCSLELTNFARANLSTVTLLNTTLDRAKKFKTQLPSNVLGGDTSPPTTK
jgi:fluoroquinolone resistance protein